MTSLLVKVRLLDFALNLTEMTHAHSPHVNWPLLNDDAPKRSDTTDESHGYWGLAPYKSRVAVAINLGAKNGAGQPAAAPATSSTPESSNGYFRQLTLTEGDWLGATFAYL